MGIGVRENVPWRNRSVPSVKQEHEDWVRANPMTADDILDYVRSFTKVIPTLNQYGIKVDVLLVASTENIRDMVIAIRKWAEETAFKLEPFVKEGKEGLATPFADLHVICYGSDRFLERLDEQNEKESRE